MSDELNQWLDARASQPGLLACAVSLAGRGRVSRSFNPACPGEQIEIILDQLAAARDLLGQNGLDSPGLAWTFEHGQIRLVARPDGAILAAACSAAAGAPANLDKLAAEFQALNLGA